MFDEGHDTAEKRADFLQGLSELLGDVRYELEALTDFDSYTPSDEESERDRLIRKTLEQGAHD